MTYIISLFALVLYTAVILFLLLKPTMGLDRKFNNIITRQIITPLTIEGSHCGKCMESISAYLSEKELKYIKVIQPKFEFCFENYQNISNKEILNSTKTFNYRAVSWLKPATVLGQRINKTITSGIAKLSMEGSHCEQCMKGISDYLSAIGGLENIKVKLPRFEIQFTPDEKINKGKIIKDIETFNYRMAAG